MNRLGFPLGLLLGLFATCVVAQDGMRGTAPSQLHFDRITVEDGLPSNNVVGVLQDHLGFIWIASHQGLVKYDGYTFRTYTHDPLDPESISGTDVKSLYEDQAGTLWIGTWSEGLNRYNRFSDTFTRFRHAPDDPSSLSSNVIGWSELILEDNQGVLWVGTDNGLNRYDPTTQTFARYYHDPDDPTSLGSNFIKLLYAPPSDSSGFLVGTERGLDRFDQDTGTFSRYAPPQDAPHLWLGEVHDVLEDREGRLWAGIADALIRYDGRTGAFTRYEPSSSDPNRLSGSTRGLLEDRDGIVWIGTDNGLNRYEPATNTFSHFRHDPDDPTSMGKGLLYWSSSLYEDREGNLWISTWTGSGISLLRPRSAGVVHHKRHPTDPLSLSGNDVSAILEDGEGTLWIGTGNKGLNRLDRPHGANLSAPGFTRYRSDPDDPSTIGPGFISFIFESPAEPGILWIGTEGDGTDRGRGNGGVLNRMDVKTGRFTRHRTPSHSLNAIAEDADGGFWLGSRTGLLHFDQQTGSFEQYQPDPGDQNSLSNAVVWDVLIERNGIIWAATDYGLNRFDPATQVFTRYFHDENDHTSISNDAIRSLHEDRKGYLWVGTRGGLNRFDRDSETFVVYTRHNSGLANNTVFSLVEDVQGRLWFTHSGSSGVSRYDPEAETFDHFGAGHGLIGAGWSLAYSPHGALYFGSSRGLYTFFPERLRADPTEPLIVLTDVRLFNESIQPAPGAPLEGPIWETEEIRFAHGQNDLTFEYVALHYKNASANRYRYFLEGYDGDWIEAGTQRTARYPKLPPGEYTFRVRAANSDGIWNEDDASVRLTILPPWWRTRWAFGFYGLLLLGGILGVERIQRRRLVRVEREAARERELEQKREIEGAYNQLKSAQQQLVQQALRLSEADEIKSRFFANISHEFRTPLTLLLGPVRDLIEGRIDAQRLATQAPVMHRNARRLLRLINQLLDLSRLEAGGMRLQARRGDLVSFLRRHVLSFTSHAERDGVALVFTAEPEVIEMAFDADKLEKIITNLLSNAFKFTPSGGRMRVMVRQVDSYVEIAVRDTGEGISAEDLPLVFDRFYQADSSSTRRHVGTGIGLSLAKELVELHGGTIRVESERGFGSTFTVRIPLRATPLVDDGVNGRSHQLRDIPGGRQADEHAQPVPLTDQMQETDNQLQADVEPEVNAPADAPCNAPANAPKILIVEDNADMRGYLRSHLAGTYRLLEAEDGADGLRQAKEHQPDLVISDVMMPEMDGFALCEAIKCNEALSHIPVILLTAKADEESRIEGFQMGADDYLPKPFSLTELTVRVENLVEIRRRLRERFSGTVRLGPAEILVNSEDASFVESARDVIEAQMGDSQFGVNRLADEMGLSERQLHRRVKETAGLTPAGYIRMMRLERASQLLEQKAGRVSDVAYAVGFKNAKYFSRLYRQTFGRAPSDEVGEDLH